MGLVRLRPHGDAGNWRRRLISELCARFGGAHEEGGRGWDLWLLVPVWIRIFLPVFFRARMRRLRPSVLFADWCEA